MDFLLSITRSCETLFKQTHWKPQERLEFILTSPKKIYPLNHQSQLMDFG